MIKILITGYMHSGTTLLHQLIKAHPQVGWIENEENYIEYKKPKEWILMFAKQRVDDLNRYAWGEKIPWGHRDNDENGKRIIWIMKRWLKFFGLKGRVVHILRHPLDVALSGQGSNLVPSALDKIEKSVPKIIDFLNSRPRTCATIVYEDLLADPQKHLKNIFEFLGLKASDKIIKKVINSPLKFDCINADRAFAYQKKGIDKQVDYDAIIDSIERRL